MRCLYKVYFKQTAVHYWVLFSFLIAGTVNAQSVSIFGGGAGAEDCYRASGIAASTGFSSREDLENCDQAIIYGKLNAKDLVATYVNRGIIRVSMKDLEGGARDYRAAINLRPDLAEPYLNRGNLWFIVQNYEAAIADYEKSIDLDIRQPQVAFLNTGMAYEYLKDYEKAKRFYESTIEITPEWSTALEKLERVTKKINEAAE